MLIIVKYRNGRTALLRAAYCGWWLTPYILLRRWHTSRCSNRCQIHMFYITALLRSNLLFVVLEIIVVLHYSLLDGVTLSWFDYLLNVERVRLRTIMYVWKYGKLIELKQDVIVAVFPAELPVMLRIICSFA